MTVLKMYEKVNLKTPLEQRRFFNYLNDSIEELQELYSKFVFDDGKGHALIESLTDECPVRPFYHEAIIDNILFLAGAGDTYKGEFVRKAEMAQLRYWHQDVKGRHVKREGW